MILTATRIPSCRCACFSHQSYRSAHGEISTELLLKRRLKDISLSLCILWRNLMARGFYKKIKTLSDLAGFEKSSQRSANISQLNLHLYPNFYFSFAFVNFHPQPTQDFLLGQTSDALWSELSRFVVVWGGKM